MVSVHSKCFSAFLSELNYVLTPEVRSENKNRNAEESAGDLRKVFFALNCIFCIFMSGKQAVFFAPACYECLPLCELCNNNITLNEIKL